jgi:hypothetical protein
LESSSEFSRFSANEEMRTFFKKEFFENSESQPRESTNTYSLNTTKKGLDNKPKDYLNFVEGSRAKKRKSFELK